MKVLLTGSTGWIGSHVARALVAAGHEVHATIRPRSDRRRLAGLESQMRIVAGEMDAVPVKPDLAIHLAWYVSPVDYLDSPENRACLEASLRLLKALDCRVVFAGTAFELDTREGTIREDGPLRPLTPYSQCKDALRREVVKRPDAAWVRFFYQYGPHEDPRRRIPSAILGLLRGEPVRATKGDERRDYLHVEDVASAVCAVATGALSGTVNIGSGTAPRMGDILGRIGELCGRPELIRWGAVPYYEEEPMLIVADNSKLCSTGWRPKYDLEAGLRHTVAWWRAA